MKVSGTTCTSPADATARERVAGGTPGSPVCEPCCLPAVEKATFTLSSAPALIPEISTAHLRHGWSPGSRDLPTGWSEWGILKWKGGFGERTLLKQDSWRKEICSVERANLLFNRLCPRQGCCQPQPRKHRLPPTTLPCYKHPSSTSVLCLARAWGSLAWVAAAGEKVATCHCSHFKEKVNGCWKMRGERQEKDYQLARNTSEPLKHCTGIISMPFSELERSASLAHRNIAYRDWGTTRF